MTYNSARIGSYYNGHNSKIIDQLNDVLQDVKDDTIIEELFVNYFDDQEIEGIIEFFKDRYRECEKEVLTFEGTERQIDLLRAEFEILRIEHNDEKLPIIIEDNLKTK